MFWERPHHSGDRRGRETTAAGRTHSWTEDTERQAVHVVCSSCSNNWSMSLARIVLVHAPSGSLPRVHQYMNYHPFGEVLEEYGSYNTNFKYTGKEHDRHSSFDYVYFGARYYKPKLGQFASIDKASQFASGYVYGMNNPLIGVDADGNWFGIDDLIVAGIAFVAGYVSYGINEGNWGWDAVKAGGISAGAAWVSYNTAGGASSLSRSLGASKQLAAVIGSGVGGAAGGMTGSSLSQVVNYGTFDLSQAWRGAKYGFAGGLASGIYGISPMTSVKFPMSNTLHYYARGLAYQAGGNLVVGKSMSDVNLYPDAGMLAPGLLDAASLTSSRWIDKAADWYIDRMVDKNRKQINDLLKKAEEKGFTINYDKSEIWIDFESANFGTTDGGLTVDLKFSSKFMLVVNKQNVDVGINLGRFGKIGGIVDLTIGVGPIELSHATTSRTLLGPEAYQAMQTAVQGSQWVY